LFQYILLTEVLFTKEKLRRRKRKRKEPSKKKFPKEFMVFMLRKRIKNFRKKKKNMVKNGLILPEVLETLEINLLVKIPILDVVVK